MRGKKVVLKGVKMVKAEERREEKRRLSRKVVLMLSGVDVRIA